MKIMILECTEEELKANRGIMDNIVDAMSGFLGSFYGSCMPAMEREGESSEESEDTE